MYIMNWKSEIIHWDAVAHRFYGRTIECIERNAAVTLRDDARAPDSASRYIFDQGDMSEREVEVPGFGTVSLCYVFATRSYHFRDDAQHYLCFDGEHDYSFSREQPGLWESFLLLSDADLEKIRHILSHRWVTGRELLLVERQDIRIDHQFSLGLGRYSLDLRYMDFALVKDYSFTAFVDGWKVERFYLYRPLIYLTAFSDPRVIAQLSLCVRSLLEIGHYDGKIVVMTDKNAGEIEAACGVPLSDTLAIVQLFPKDFTGFVCAKYSIYDSAEFAGYQPLMYLDPDIICDRPIDDMLACAAASERICAPLEGWNQLRNHPPIGATLLQLDNLEPRYASGLNGGTITITNVSDEVLRERFELIRSTVANVGDKFGRSFNRWADQEVANYIAYKMGAFDTNSLTRFVQWQDGRRPIPGNRVGLVHFWGHPTDEKVERMRRYLDELRQIEPRRPNAMRAIPPDDQHD